MWPSSSLRSFFPLLFSFAPVSSRMCATSAASSYTARVLPLVPSGGVPSSGVLACSGDAASSGAPSAGVARSAALSASLTVTCTPERLHSPESSDLNGCESPKVRQKSAIAPFLPHHTPAGTLWCGLPLVTLLSEWLAQFSCHYSAFVAWAGNCGKTTQVQLSKPWAQGRRAVARWSTVRKYQGHHTSSEWHVLKPHVLVIPPQNLRCGWPGKRCSRMWFQWRQATKHKSGDVGGCGRAATTPGLRCPAVRSSPPTPANGSVISCDWRGVNNNLMENRPLIAISDRDRVSLMRGEKSSTGPTTKSALSRSLQLTTVSVRV